MYTFLNTFIVLISVTFLIWCRPWVVYTCQRVWNRGCSNTTRKGFFLRAGIVLFCLCCVAGLNVRVAFSDDTDAREAATTGEATEMHFPGDASFTPWIHNSDMLEKDEGDKTELRKVIEKDVKTIKLNNLVPPIHFGQGEIDIPEDYLNMLRKVLKRMRNRHNVRLHFVGHADNLKLRGELKKLYGDNIGLSRERAGTVAEYCQKALKLPPEAISYEGLGDSKPVAGNRTKAGRQKNRRVEVEVWYDEVREKEVEKEVVVRKEVVRVKVCRTETVCKLRYKEGHANRARIKNLVSPLHYDKGMLNVSREFLRQIRQSIKDLGRKQNLVIKFIGYSDNVPLTGRDKRIYGTLTNFTKAVARRAALAVQDDFKPVHIAVETEGKGASYPITTNDTEKGRALNRRVEVEFWHDDPLQDLPDEPQLCPDASGAETVTRVYESPAGGIEPVFFNNGGPVIPKGYTEKLRKIMDEVKNKSNVRLRFIGYTGNERLDRRTAAVYGDDVGLSTARAKRTMEAVGKIMGLNEEQLEYEGHGYVQSEDVVNSGFVSSATSRVNVQVVYDELIISDEYEGVEVTPMTREVTIQDPFALNQMRITVDGHPVDDPGKACPDVQRCTDVALDDALIQFKHDSLKLEPRLNITAWPRNIRYQDLEDTPFPEDQVRFRLYSNYQSFIKEAEVRIFKDDQSVRDNPIAVVKMNKENMAQWQANFDSLTSSLVKLKYLVRVYDEKRRFDETVPQPLWVESQIDLPIVETDLKEELLAGYGESRIAIHNIPLHGGTVTAYGTAIPDGHSVWLAGFHVPVDSKGDFIAEQILPEGLLTVEIAVLDEFGNGDLYLRDLSLKKNDWFTVGIADLTMSLNKTDGPAELLVEDQSQFSEEMSVHGRLAFYTNGKFKNGWSLTASADTEEGPLDEIFTNYLDKDPDALFRRMDPDYHYPTFGDDSTVIDDAPTSGKFYIKVEKDNTYGLWGNFKKAYNDTDLAQVDRGLYGANLHFQPLDTTSFGEPRLMVDGFGADPGTIAGRDDLRGTGGSLYFLERQDILTGSERIRVEVRDKDSGIVLGVKNLTPILDYDIDYLQGRILLCEPLSSTADDGLLVSSESINGHPVYLVVRYEYTPGFEDPGNLAYGGRVHYWLNDYVKVGLTASQEEDLDRENKLTGADITLRKSANSWLKVETGQTNGPGMLASTSTDGGYSYTSPDLFEETVDAMAYRLDANLGLNDFFKQLNGRLSFYFQETEAGYSAPGQSTVMDVTQYGGSAELPVTKRINTQLKVDKKEQDQGLTTETGEVNAGYRMTSHWELSSGVRYDNREDNSLVVPSTQEEGKRTDGVVKVGYDSLSKWRSYGFAQETLQTSDTREDNGRFGAGGSYQVTSRFKVDGEVSDGDLGTGAKAGTQFLYSDRTTLYAGYSLENERSDSGLRARKGNMTSGVRTRYSDSASVYVEEQYVHGDVPSGLLHSTGVKLSPYDHLNLGASLDAGTLKDHETSAETERLAIGMSAGYGLEKLNLASGVEYRVDNTEQPDTTTNKRTTWLLKNNLKYQLSTDWRLIGKLNYSQSESSLGQFYDGDYTECVFGGAYRPVENDRLNALLKYTYFYNVPVVTEDIDQIAGTGFIQRSHIGAVDVMYNFTRRWTLGGKYAYRYGRLSQDRVNPDFFTSRAHLGVLRAEWHALHSWDALMEGRILMLPDAEDRMDGVLVGIYKHFGNHIKLGAGYNFSRFTDDLTDLNYEHQGFFINIIGKY